MRSFKGLFHLAFLAGAILLGNLSAAWALEDGFRYDQKAEGKYITAYCAPGVDPAGLARQLNLSPSDQILPGQALRPDRGGELAPMLDTLFLKVSNILDMHLYSLKTDVKVCGTNEDLADIYR